MEPPRSDGPVPKEMQRVEGFLDCLARLLAKRWLRDQREVDDSEATSAEDTGNQLNFEFGN